ncbi:hypothetical protein ACH5RR_016625 [Cinchona calisaya]|uniref:RRM domain-containing protein n=1 Tax=Cinchona calisaya TaxID=153742 RepID=A0ABD2ZWH6_9GENT
MADGLDMSLDDLIKKNNKSRGDNGNFRTAQGGRGRGRADLNYGPGPTRRSSVLAPFRVNPYSSPYGLWLPENWIAPAPAPAMAIQDAGTKLYVSNLHYGVTNEDIKVLFSDVGELKRYAVHYNCSGRSKGTAEVVFTRHSDALAAIKRYNDLRLDGRPIKIELVGVNDFTTSAMSPASDGILGHHRGAFRHQDPYCIPSAMSPASDGSLGYQRGAFRRNSMDVFKQGGHGQGRGGRRDRTEKVSAEALDTDLEKYCQDAMPSSS